MLLLFVIPISELLDIDQTDKKRRSILTFSLIEKLVDKALATTSPMDQHVFKLFELPHMNLNLEVAPSGVLPHIAATKAIITAIHLEPPGGLIHHTLKKPKKSPRLRWQFIKGPSKDFISQTIGHLDVLQRDLDVGHALAMMVSGL